MREGGGEGGLQREVKKTLKLQAWKSMRMTDSVLPVAMEYKSLIANLQAFKRCIDAFKDLLTSH